MYLWRYYSVVAVFIVHSTAAVDDRMCCVSQTVYIERTLEKEGFHRDLVTRFSLPWPSEEHSVGGQDTDCRLLLLEHLPSGVYVDPYELRRTATQPLQVLDAAHVDIEAMAHRAQPVQMMIWPRLNLTQHTQVSVDISVPIHGRYHRVDESFQHAQVYIEPPQVLLTCDRGAMTVVCSCAVTRLPCGPFNSALCQYETIQLQNRPTVVMDIPVGDLSDMEMVVVGTAVTVLAGCVFLVIVILRKDPDKTKLH